NYIMGGQPGALKFGLRYRDEQKNYNQNDEKFSNIGSFGLTQALTGFTDPSFYNYLQPGFPLGPLPDFGTTTSFENAHPDSFNVKTDTVGNALATFNGKERILAGYIMNNMDLSSGLHLNLGVRVEMTHSSYLGHVATSDTAGNTTGISTVTGTQDYTDIF